MHQTSLTVDHQWNFASVGLRDLKSDSVQAHFYSYCIKSYAFVMKRKEK